MPISTAVILAAGRSERMAAQTNGSSKALLRVGGLAMLERSILAAQRAGVERVVVVTGHDGDRVGRLASKTGRVTVEVVRADRWSLGNGSSLSAAEEAAGSEPLFLLVMADHLFGPGALEALLEVHVPAALVDMEPDAAVAAEGTKVAVVEDQALGFGKELDARPVDCGAFLVSPGIFRALAHAAAAGDHTLAGALTRLADAQPVAVVPVPRDSWWRDVDTPADLAAASRDLRRSLAKPTDGPVARWLNRPLSTRLTMWLARLRPNPDVVSLLAFGLTVAGAGLLGLGQGVAGGILVQASSVLDGVDGELARLLGRSSSRGALMDSLLDRVADSAVMAGLGLWTLTAGTPPATTLLLVAGAIAGAFLSMAIKDRSVALRLAAFPEHQLGWLLGGRDGRLLLVAVFAVLGRPLWALVAVLVTSAVSAAARLALVTARHGP